MRKFRLKKSYPGSPKIGTIVEKDERYGSDSYKNIESNNIFYVLNHHVEDNPEYWEEVVKNKFMVSTKYSYAYEIYTVSLDFKGKEHEHLFNTKEDAEEFIIREKPCLSFSDLIWNFSENTKKNRLEVDIDDLRKLAKSKRDVCLAHRTKNEW